MAIVVLITLTGWEAHDHPGLVNPLPIVRTRSISELIAESLPLLKTPFDRTVEITISAPNLNERHRVASVLSAFNAPKLSCARHTCATDLTWTPSLVDFPALPKQANLQKLCTAVIAPLRAAAAYRNLTYLHLIRCEPRFTWERLRDTLEAAHELTVLVLADVGCTVPQRAADISMPKLDSFQLTYSRDEYVQLAAIIDMPNIRRVRFEACGVASLLPVHQTTKRMTDNADALDIFVADNILSDLVAFLPSLSSTGVFCFGVVGATPGTQLCFLPPHIICASLGFATWRLREESLPRSEGIWVFVQLNMVHMIINFVRNELFMVNRFKLGLSEKRRRSKESNPRRSIETLTSSNLKEPDGATNGVSGSSCEEASVERCADGTKSTNLRPREFEWTALRPEEEEETEAAGNGSTAGETTVVSVGSKKM
ncbi:hypothetical protein DFH06DRAFT_1152842 [Mycena polygramma]|nr:hypothetical protein DFH06DRAFT_1152842 [Mycena polygramma]